MPIKAVLFDLDGVLVDATEWHYEAFTHALRDYGIEISRELHDSVLNGLPTWQKLDILNVRQDHCDLIEIAKQNYFQEIMEQRCAPDKKKIRLLKALKKKGYKVGVCSNARSLSTYRMLERGGLLPYVDRTYGSDDVDHPKPSPEIYQEAMKNFGVKPSETVIVEDSRPGVEAAKASLGKVVVTPDYATVTNELLKAYL